MLLLYTKLPVGVMGNGLLYEGLAVDRWRMSNTSSSVRLRVRVCVCICELVCACVWECVGA